MGRHIENTITPAMEVRRRHMADGFSNLSLDEKQWTMLDKVREKNHITSGVIF
jgi:hypothetical protein